MKTYMPLDGLRWSRDSGSALCDTPQSAVLGRPGGGYICYLLLLFVIGEVFRLIAGNERVWHIGDFWELLLSGNCSAYNDVEIEGVTYSLSVLWYLYSGFCSLLLIRLLSRFIKHYSVHLIIALSCYYLTLLYCLIMQVEANRLFYLSFPFISIGISLAKIQITKPNKMSCETLMLAMVLFIFISIVEFKLHSLLTDSYFATLPLSVLTFMLLLYNPMKFQDGIIKQIPSAITLDLYVWHKPLMIFFILIDLPLIGKNPIIIIVIIFIVSFIIRKYENIKNINRKISSI